MSEYQDHRWPVSVKNTVKNNTVGAVRWWCHAPWFIHFGWAMTMSLYTFLGWLISTSAAGLVAWEIVFGLLWAGVWSMVASWGW